MDVDQLVKRKHNLACDIERAVEDLLEAFEKETEVEVHDISLSIGHQMTFGAQKPVRVFVNSQVSLDL